MLVVDGCSFLFSLLNLGLAVDASIFSGLHCELLQFLSIIKLFLCLWLKIMPCLQRPLKVTLHPLLCLMLAFSIWLAATELNFRTSRVSRVVVCSVLLLWGRLGGGKEVELMKTYRHCCLTAGWVPLKCKHMLCIAGRDSTMRIWPRQLLLGQRSCALASPLPLGEMLLDEGSVTQHDQTN